MCPWSGACLRSRACLHAQTAAKAALEDEVLRVKVRARAGVRGAGAAVGAQVHAQVQMKMMQAELDELRSAESAQSSAQRA